MSVVVRLPDSDDGPVPADEYLSGVKWHIDQFRTLHVIGASGADGHGGAGPFDPAAPAGNVASYAEGAWLAVRLERTPRSGVSVGRLWQKISDPATSPEMALEFLTRALAEERAAAELPR